MLQTEYGPRQMNIFHQILLWPKLTINWDELFLNKHCLSPKDEDNLKFRNNESQLPITIQLLVYCEANYMK